MSKYRSQAAALGVFLTLFCFAATAGAQESSGKEPEGQEEVERGAVPQGPTPKLFILPTDSLEGQVSELVTDRINEAKRGLLARDRNLELLPTFREIVSQRAGSAYANVAQAEKIYTSAIGLLNVGNYQRAAELFQQALDIMMANLSGIQNYGVFSDTLSNLAAAYFHSGFDLDGRQNIQKFAHLKPGATLDPEIFPAALREVYQSEVERVESAGAGVLHIQSDREGVMIFIDGELKGQAPLTVEDVGFGYHYLVARTSDSAVEREIRVRGRGQEQTIEANFDEAGDDGSNQVPSYYVDLQEILRTGIFSDDVEPYLAELSNQTQADFVAWVILVRERSEYLATPFVYRSRDGAMIQGERTSFNLELSNLRSRISRLTGIISLAVSDMPEDLVVTEVDLTKQPEPEPEPPPVVVAAEPKVEPEPSGVDETAAVAEAPQEPLPVPGRTPEATGLIADPGVAGGEDEARSKKWRYMAWGGGALLAGGAIAGTIIFLARGASASGPASFEAEVEW